MIAYRFPPIANLKSIEPVMQLAKINEEMDEVNDAFLLESTERFIEECFDLIHSLETMTRRLVPDCVADKIRADVEEKNRARGYYGSVD